MSSRESGVDTYLFVPILVAHAQVAISPGGRCKGDPERPSPAAPRLAYYMVKQKGEEGGGTVLRRSPLGHEKLQL